MDKKILFEIDVRGFLLSCPLSNECAVDDIMSPSYKTPISRDYYAEKYGAGGENK